MPIRPLSPCTFPGCPKFADPGRSRCPEHHREADRGRDRTTKYGTSRWRRKRAAFLRRHPICVDCGGIATVADHAPTERRDLVAQGVADPDADQYLQPRCKPCHDKRTARTSPGGWNAR